MKLYFFAKMKFLMAPLLALSSLSILSLTQAEEDGWFSNADWFTITFDNDAFVGNDNGYSNGINFSWWDTASDGSAEQGWLSKAMSWSLPANAGKPIQVLSGHTIGQFMQTPDDITIVDPPLGDLPYTGLLYYSNTYIQTYPTYADKIKVTLGIVGKYSFAEESQKAIHSIIGSDEPLGWDTQTGDEIVFAFGRSRAWRGWIADNGRSEIITGVGAEVGTIQSLASVGFMYRNGNDLERTYATALLVSDRTSNPVAVEGARYFFIGMRAAYLANSIFYDGNTYKDSRSVDDYKNELISFTVGYAYSWKNFGVTFAIGDLNVLEDEGVLEEATEYGTLTFVWRAK